MSRYECEDVTQLACLRHGYKYMYCLGGRIHVQRGFLIENTQYQLRDSAFLRHIPKSGIRSLVRVIMTFA